MFNYVGSKKKTGMKGKILCETTNSGLPYPNPCTHCLTLVCNQQFRSMHRRFKPLLGIDEEPDRTLLKDYFTCEIIAVSSILLNNLT